MCEHYIARGLCTDFPDWTIAVAGCESCVKIGYDYGRSVTGVEHEVEPDLNEEDQVLVPDPQEERMMVATSSEVCTAVCIDFFLRLFKYRGLDSCLESVIVICILWLQVLKELGLDAVDLLDDEGIDMGMDKDSVRYSTAQRQLNKHTRATRVQHACDTRATRVRHACDTRARVLNFTTHVRARAHYAYVMNASTNYTCTMCTYNMALYVYILYSFFGLLLLQRRRPSQVCTVIVTQCQLQRCERVLTKAG